jgi:hypothetical protein
MGAVTVAIKRRYYPDGGKLVIADVTFSSSYGAGGDTYTNQQFEMSQVDAIVDMGAAVTAATTGLLLDPDIANNKLRLLGMAAAAGVGTPFAETNVAGQTGTVVRVAVLGNNVNI